MAIINTTSSNPILSEKVFEKHTGLGTGLMTVQGTVNKSIFGILLIVVSAAWSWGNIAEGGNMAWILFGAIGGAIAAFVTLFKPTWGPVTVPVYAVLEGLFLGALSALFESMYPGIVLQAVGLTFGTMFAMLFAYKTGLIKVTQKFRSGVIMATGGIALVYLMSWIFGMFGIHMPMVHSGGLFGIGFSLFVIVIAALNLLLDFDFIHRGAGQGAPKYMEWVGALGLMLTLVWLYIEFLRLLSRINRD